MNRTVVHKARAIHAPALHVKHAAKIAKVTKRSRLWCEIGTCAGTAYETHLIVLTIITLVWLVVDVVLIVIGKADEV